MARPEIKDVEATSPTPVPAPAPPPLLRLGAAVLLSAIAALLTWLFQPYLGSVVFIFFYPAVMLAAWYGGFAAGGLVGVLALLAIDFLFVGEPGHLTLPAPTDLVFLALFLFMAFLVSLAVNRMRAAQARAEHREADARRLAARLTEQAEQLEVQAADLESQTVELEQAMEDAELSRADAQTAFERSEVERRRVSILAETSRALTESHDYRDRLAALGALVVRELADFCVIDVLSDSGVPERLVTTTREAAKTEPLARLRALPPRLDAAHGVGRVLRTGEPEVLLELEACDLEGLAQSDEHLDVLRELEPRSLIVMPLTAGERCFGAISLVRSSGLPPFEPADVELARVMAARAAVLIELARLYREAMAEIERRRVIERQLSEKAAELEQLNVEQERMMAQLGQRTEQAEAAERHAQEASQAKSQFLAVMSHELRTPLNAIMGYTDLLQSGAAGVELGETGRSFLDRIRVSVLHLRGLIDEVLSLSRIEAGKEEVSPERVNLGTVLREVAAMVQADALRKGLRVRVEVESDVIATTDVGKLRQILINLASNAVKFTDEGSVRLALRARRGVADIEVIDTGVGIADEHLEHIFEPFTQVDQSRTRRAGGTGLGLPVSRKLARLLGGDIRVASDPGSGSCFTFTLPLELPADTVSRPAESHAGR
jgi:signal transduction histidine kinase